MKTMELWSFFKPPGETRHNSSLTHRIMFHPDTPEGRVLLDRIKDAFCNGVIDVICWPQLPQRTSPYISRKHHMTACHLALNGMGIPQVSRPNRLVETRTRAADRGNDKPKHAQRDKVSIVVPQLGATIATASFIVDVEASPSTWLALRHGHVESSLAFGAKGADAPSEIIWCRMLSSIFATSRLSLHAYSGHSRSPFCTALLTASI